MPLTKDESDYFDNVFEFAEYIGLDVLVEDFEADGVANSISKSIAICYTHNISYRQAALLIYALTWDKIKNNKNIITHYKVH